jgi:hypothetical protein
MKNRYGHGGESGKKYKLALECKRGHLFKESNTRIVELRDGYTARQCKQCRSIRDRLRYRNNPAYQASARARALIRANELRTP